MSNKTNTYFGFSMMIVAVVVALDLSISTAMSGVLDQSGGPADMSVEAIAARIAPVGKLNTGAAIAAPAPALAPAVTEAPATASAAARSGEDVYNSSCLACHATGAAGAPKLGDSAAWSPRIAKGMEALVQSAINGVPGTSMMAKGTCTDCSVEELKLAVEHMTSKSQ